VAEKLRKKPEKILQNGLYPCSKSKKAGLAALRQSFANQTSNNKLSTSNHPAMKNNALLFLIMVFLSGAAIAQKYTRFSDIQPFRKGKIILKDGTSVNCRNISVKNDSVSFYDQAGTSYQYSGDNVYKVVKIGNYAVTSAITCGLAGLLGSVVGTLNWTTSPLKESKGTFIIVSTAGCAVLGGLVGLAIKKETIVYKNGQTMSFFPSVLFDNKNRLNSGITCRITL
jgi:hypothetical protein